MKHRIHRVDQASNCIFVKSVRPYEETAVQADAMLFEDAIVDDYIKALRKIFGYVFLTLVAKA